MGLLEQESLDVFLRIRVDGRLLPQVIKPAHPTQQAPNIRHRTSDNGLHDRGSGLITVLGAVIRISASSPYFMCA
jgi:hypothetical protein